MLRTIPRFALLVALLATPWFLSAKDPREPPVVVEVVKPRIPLGIEGFFVRPSRRTMYVMGTAHSSFFGGWRIVGTGPRRAVIGSDGTPVLQFPTHVQFRITAQAVDNPNLFVERDLLDINDDLNHFLLNLRFRLKIFHGLEATPVTPDLVELVGMPADVQYDERVYRLSFTLPPVPIEDRIVLEVLRPDNGKRLCKFHLEF